MWECYIGVRHTGCPISDTSAALPTVSIQNVSKANVPDGFGRRLLYIRGDAEDIDRFEEVCQSHGLVKDFQFVSKNEGAEAYYAIEIGYDETNPSVLSIINSRGIFHHGSIGVREGIEQWLVYNSKKERIQELIDEIESYDNNVSIYRMVDLGEIGHISSIEHGFLLAELTAQQQTTFRTALEMDYYEDGSETVISDIADRLDRHETTTWEHLKKAENTILTTIGDRLFSSRTIDKQ